jgi:hypothetical protein
VTDECVPYVGSWQIPGGIGMAGPQAKCSCGWKGKERTKRSAAQEDAIRHACGHDPELKRQPSRYAPSGF